MCQSVRQAGSWALDYTETLICVVAQKRFFCLFVFYFDFIIIAL